MDTEFSLVNARTNQKTDFKLTNENFEGFDILVNIQPCFTLTSFILEGKA